MLLFVAAPVAFAVAQAVRSTAGDDDSIEARREDRRGSTQIRSSGDVRLPDRVPLSYDITYLSTDTSRDPVTVTNERHQVRRPFHARVTIRQGDEPGSGDIVGQRVSTETSLATAGRDARWLLLEIGPAIATSDLRFGSSLEQALAEGDFHPREQRRVEGRTCQVFRAGSSVQAGNLVPYEPGADSWADVCIDDAGLVLEELWVLDGRRVQRRLAIDVEEDVEFDDDLFDAPDDATALAVGEGGGSVTRLTPDSRPPGLFHELPSDVLPDGFTLMGKYALITPRLELARDPTAEAKPQSTSSVATVYVRGPDVLVVDQGNLTGDGTLPPAPTGRDVDLGRLGQGTAFTDLRANEVRALRGSEYLRVYGTIPIQQLLAVTRELAVVEGGSLTPADPATTDG